jgi:hypothetical protein
MSYLANSISSNILINALLEQAPQQAPVPQAPPPLAPLQTPQPVADIIRAPPHYHCFWTATRARKFARVLLNDPKHRGTFDQNIRLIASKTHPGVDVRLFIQKVNPVLWCLKVGWSRFTVQKLIVRNDLQTLWQRCAYSSCDHCRDLANKYSGFYFFTYTPIPSNPAPTCV